jgi:hypothetical protein
MFVVGCWWPGVFSHAASGSIEAKDAEIVFRWTALDGQPHPERFTGAIFISAGVAFGILAESAAPARPRLTWRSF